MNCNTANPQSICPACQSAVLSVFFEMPDVPVYCNVLWPSREAALEAPRGNVRLGFCHACGMIYNVAFDPSLVSYSPDYENSLHGSPRFQQYAMALAERLIDKYELRGKNIIEIGCGKGEFLALLCASGGNRGIGFDASYDGSREAAYEASHLTFVQDYYSEAYASYEANLVCCRHVLEHIPEPRSFLENVSLAAGKSADTAVFFEVPNVLYTLRDLGIWDIIYEHCSYFAAPSLTRLFHEVGFMPHDVYTTFGDQFLCLEASLASSRPETGMEAASEVDGLWALASEFTQHYKNKVDLWEYRLACWHEQQKRIAVWGAGSKGVTFLNLLKGGRCIRRVVDVNPRKQGMYVAGTAQRIVSPEALAASGADIILIMNPMYRDEIQEQVRQYRMHAELFVV